MASPPASYVHLVFSPFWFGTDEEIPPQRKQGFMAAGKLNRREATRQRKPRQSVLLIQSRIKIDKMMTVHVRR